MVFSNSPFTTNFNSEKSVFERACKPTYFRALKASIPILSSANLLLRTSSGLSVTTVNEKNFSYRSKIMSHHGTCNV